MKFKSIGRRLAALSVVILSAAGLTGCAPSGEQTDNRPLIISATPMWASVAKAIGGERIRVESLITSLGQDPHSFEASARDKLLVDEASLAIVNGGGYDTFLETMINSLAGERAPNWFSVQRDLDPSGENEHYWFDVKMVGKVAEGVADWLYGFDVKHKVEYRTNLRAFNANLVHTQQHIAQVAALVAAAGPAKAKVLTTEPLADYLIHDLGLINQTPAEFSEAIEEETDAPVAALNSMLDALKSGTVSLLIVNNQTSTSQVDQLIQAAGDQVPIVRLDEFQSSPDESYFAWFEASIDDIVAKLGLSKLEW